MMARNEIMQPRRFLLKVIAQSSVRLLFFMLIQSYLFFLLDSRSALAFGFEPRKALSRE